MTVKGQRPVIPPKHGVFLTIGIGHPRDTKAGKDQLLKAANALQREGFRVGVTSDEAVVAQAQAIELRKAVTNREEPHPE